MAWYHNLAALIGVCLGAAVVAVASRSAERSRGKNIFAHIILVGIAVAAAFIPEGAKELIFTQLSVIIVGTAFPIYESIRAACTVDYDYCDDTTWLSYWIAQAIVSFSTEWVDGFGQDVTTAWNQFEFFFYLWLILPMTDGADLFFSVFLKPIIKPIIQPLVAKFDGIINKIIMALTNAAHLGLVWVVFVFLPVALRRAIWIMIGTVYPLLASVISVTSDDEADDTYWLIYWSCFGILFLVVDFVENYLGFIPGFYTICILVTVYLMLPMFRGSEQVFRRILVPIAGLQEMLVRKDADRIRTQALAELPPERRALVMKEIAASFEKGATEDMSKRPVSPDGYSEIV